MSSALLEFTFFIVEMSAPTENLLSWGMLIEFWLREDSSKNLLSSIPTDGPPLIPGSSRLAYGRATVFYAVELLMSVRRLPGDWFKLFGSSMDDSIIELFLSAILTLQY